MVLESFCVGTWFNNSEVLRKFFFRLLFVYISFESTEVCGDPVGDFVVSVIQLSFFVDYLGSVGPRLNAERERPDTSRVSVADSPADC